MILRQLFDVLTDRMRRRLRRSLVLSALSGPIELLGLAAFVPFLAALSAAGSSGVSEARVASLPGPLQQVDLRTAAVIVGSAIVLRAAFVAYTQVDQMRTGWLIQASLSTRLLEALLLGDYELHRTGNTDELSSVVLSETEAVTGRVVTPLLAITGAMSTTLLLIVALILLEPILAAIAFTSVAGAYLLTSAVTRAKSTEYAEARSRLNASRFDAVAESLEAYKELWLSNRHDGFTEAYREQAGEYSRLMSWSLAIGAAPRYVVEAVVVLAIVVFVLVTPDSGASGTLASLGIFGVGAYRLLPSVQVIYHGMQSVRFGRVSLLRVIEMLYNGGRDVTERAWVGEVPSPDNLARIAGDSALILEAVSFRYPEDDEPLFSEMTLTADPGTIIGIAGRTGSGKSTLLDVIAGLLAPTSGRVRVGDVDVHRLPRSAWAQVCSYVPQHPRLLSGSIAQNIALSRNEYDESIVAEVLQIVGFDDAYASKALLRVNAQGAVGQDGSQLSGGQRQRIGLARALYQSPKILLLDESTSALDVETESRVLRNLGELGITVLLVAHRENALKDCDRVMMVDN